MKKQIILLISIIGITAYSQQEKKEVYFPITVYDQIMKIKNAKWNKSPMPLTDKIIEVTEKGKFLYYEIPSENKNVKFYVNNQPYDYMMIVSNDDKTDVKRVYFMNNTFWMEHHFKSGNEFWVYYYSEKKFEYSMRIKK